MRLNAYCAYRKPARLAASGQIERFTPGIERRGLEWKLHHFRCDSIDQRVPLALARVPNIAGREPIEAFTPSYLRVRLAVDIHIEVVAEWESETFR